jgi:low temperature requirement protein LtrA
MPRQLEALWVAILVQVLGRIGDGIWHLNHADFEGAADQLEAHFILWTGMLMTLAAAAWALRSDGAPERRAGYLVTFVGALLYIPTAIWHFIGHANGEELDVAHFLLAVTQVATIVGAIMATVRSRRLTTAPGHPPRR